jgi:hypothetical protein
LVGNAKRKNHMEDLSADWRKILKRIRKKEEKVWT